MAPPRGPLTLCSPTCSSPPWCGRQTTSYRIAWISRRRLIGPTRSSGVFVSARHRPDAACASWRRCRAVGRPGRSCGPSRADRAWWCHAACCRPWGGRRARWTCAVAHVAGVVRPGPGGRSVEAAGAPLRSPAGGPCRACAPGTPAHCGVVPVGLMIQVPPPWLDPLTAQDRRKRADLHCQRNPDFCQGISQDLSSLSILTLFYLSSFARFQGPFAVKLRQRKGRRAAAGQRVAVLCAF